MKAKICALIIVCIMLATACVGAQAQFVEVPALHSFVTDTVGALGARAQNLSQKLEALKATKGSEVAVLIVSSTKPETIEQYGIRVVDAWKLGRQGIDDGALLLVALSDRTVRIEVGRGLEGDLPDAKASRIIQEQILPRFKAGDIPGGVEAGVDAILRLIEGMELPAPQQDHWYHFDLSWLLLIAGFYLGIALSPTFGKGVGASSGSLFVFLIGWLATSLLSAIPLAVLCALLVFFGDSDFPPSGRRRYRYYYGGRHGSGGSFGGGGSFSGGGGGSFSGGGASGSW